MALLLGLLAVFSLLVSVAVSNFFTKEIATAGGLVFTALFFAMFTITERFAPKRAATRDGERGTWADMCGRLGPENQPLSVLCAPYRILALLGEGGMGRVFRARHEALAEEPVWPKLQAFCPRARDYFAAAGVPDEQKLPRTPPG